MIDFKSLQNRLDEKRANAVVFTFGRFQPPTSGHELLINATVAEANKRGAENRIYMSRRDEPKKNPLKIRDKIKFLKKFFPKANIMNDRKANTAFDVCEQLSNEGVKDVIMVVGSDRVQEFKDGISKYIGPDGYDFDSFDVVSAGERDPEASGVVGMSGTKIRAAVTDNDFQTFRKGLPSTAKDRDAHALFDAMRKGMGIRESALEESVITNTQLKLITKVKEARDTLNNLYDDSHQTIAVALMGIPEVENIVGTVTDEKLEFLMSKIPTMIDEYKNTMSAAELKKREKIVKGMKKKKGEFKDRYGKDAKNVMYATATKMAMKDDVQHDPLKPQVSIVEQEDKKQEKITVICLTTSEGSGDGKDTVTKIEKSCKKFGLEFHIIRVGEAYVVDDDLNDNKITIYNYDGKENDLDIEASDTCCFVRGGALVDITGIGIAKTLQEAGVFLINDMESMELCQNKFATSIALQKAGILHPKTALITNEDAIETVHEKIGGDFPVVVKTITGAEGIGVMIVDSMASLKSVLQGLWKYDAELIIQEYMEIDYDVRTLVLDGKIHASVKRLKSNSGDFRTNKALGNETEPYILSEEEKELILKSANLSGCYYCGVDHVTVNKEHYILEVNGSPGSAAEPFMSYYGEDKKVSGQEVIDNVLDYVSDTDNWERDKTVVGVIENVVVEGMKFKAKMDTGNGSYTSIHATDIKQLSDTRVSFKIDGKKFIKPIKGVKRIRVSGAENKESRFVVELELGFGTGIKSPTLFSLDDRDDMIYPVLVGKHELMKRRYIVDVAKKFTVS